MSHENVDHENDDPNTANESVESPCIGLCCLDDRDICVGCYRSVEEITLWGSQQDNWRKMVLLKARQRQLRADDPGH